MTETPAPYRIAMSPATMLMLSKALSRWLDITFEALPYYQVTPDEWQEIAMCALAIWMERRDAHPTP